MTAFDTSPPPTSISGGRRRSLLRRAGIGVLLLALVAAIAGVTWTWRHPKAFEGYGGWTVGTTHAPVGETVYVGMTFPDGQDGSRVRIHGADPRGLSNSAGATFAYYVCTHVAGASYAPVGLLPEADFRRACSRAVPATDAMASVGTQQLVVAITPRRSGVVAFHGLDLRYRDGWQDGTQRVGGDVSIDVRDAG